MAIISLLSAKGSPGVTTSVVALTMAWASAHGGRSAVAVDADPIGGDTAAGILGGTVPSRAGILALATARGVAPLEALDSASVHLRADGSARLVPGVPDAARAAALSLAWDVVAGERIALHRDGCDVIVDAGRVGIAERSWPWLADSDLALLVVRPTLPSVVAAHRFAAAWPLPEVPLHLLVVEAASPYSPAEVTKAAGVPLQGVIPWDPERARVHYDGSPPSRGFERSEYARGVRGAAVDIGRVALERANLHLPAADPAGVDAASALGDPRTVPSNGGEFA